MSSLAHDPAQADFDNVLEIINQRIAVPVLRERERTADEQGINAAILSDALTTAAIEELKVDWNPEGASEEELKRLTSVKELMQYLGEQAESGLRRLGAIADKSFDEARLKDQVFAELTSSELEPLQRLCNTISERVAKVAGDSYNLTPKSLFETLAHQVTSQWDVSIDSLVADGARWVKSLSSPHSI